MLYVCIVNCRLYSIKCTYYREFFILAKMHFIPSEWWNLIYTFAYFLVLICCRKVTIGENYQFKMSCSALHLPNMLRSIIGELVHTVFVRWNRMEYSVCLALHSPRTNGGMVNWTTWVVGSQGHLWGWCLVPLPPPPLLPHPKTSQRSHPCLTTSLMMKSHSSTTHSILTRYSTEICASLVLWFFFQGSPLCSPLLPTTLPFHDHFLSLGIPFHPPTYLNNALLGFGWVRIREHESTY